MKKNALVDRPTTLSSATIPDTAGRLDSPPKLAYDRHMPFTPYKPSLSPDTPQTAQIAFDLAWAEIEAQEGYDLQLTRDLLAKRIMEAIQEHGERDPERLKALALEGFEP